MHALRTRVRVFFSKFLPSPLLVGGGCAALLLVLLAGFVPGRSGGELRLPLQKTAPPSSRLTQGPVIRPLDTTGWMVRMPMSQSRAADRAAVDVPGDVGSEAFLAFADDGVSLLTTEGPRWIRPPGDSGELFRLLQRETYGLPNGLTLARTAVIDGKDMPWCAPASGSDWASQAMRRSWLRRQSLPYIEHVKPWVKRFNLDRDLIYAIMFTESGFNPLVISNQGAHGLMQIVPDTAGHEVHRYLFGASGRPKAVDLLTPSVNIQYGTTYLHLLFTRHMQGIVDPRAREYCTIAAYNGGSGVVLRVFGESRDEAFAAINQLSPAQVYDRLQQGLPSRETRQFLRKVLSLKQGLSVAAR